MRILVTGSRGIMGRHLLRYLDRYCKDAEVLSSRADLTVFEAIKQEISTFPPVDKVFHLAALVPVASVASSPSRAYAVNVGGTVNLLRAFEGSNISFVFCSTSHVYSPSPRPIAEGDQKMPVTIYGRTKLMAEMAAEDICRHANWPFLAARVFSIHDPEQTGSYLRPSIERRLKTDDLSKPFELKGGNSCRDMMPAERAAELLVRLSLSPASGAVNVATGRATRVADFVQSLSPVRLNIHAIGDADTLVADVSLLKNYLGDIDG